MAGRSARRAGHRPDDGDCLRGASRQPGLVDGPSGAQRHPVREDGGAVWRKGVAAAGSRRPRDRAGGTTRRRGAAVVGGGTCNRAVRASGLPRRDAHSRRIRAHGGAAHRRDGTRAGRPAGESLALRGRAARGGSDGGPDLRPRSARRARGRRHRASRRVPLCDRRGADRMAAPTRRRRDERHPGAGSPILSVDLLSRAGWCAVRDRDRPAGIHPRRSSGGARQHAQAPAVAGTAPDRVMLACVHQHDLQVPAAVRTT